VKFEQPFEIEFPEGYVGQWENDTPSRGWLEVKVIAPDGKRYRLSFYDIVRLKQTLDSCLDQGMVHYAEPNLVIISEVNTTNIYKAVTDLAADGYFDIIRSETAD
jgi:hypothetical protein